LFKSQHPAPVQTPDFCAGPPRTSTPIGPADVLDAAGAARPDAHVARHSDPRTHPGALLVGAQLGFERLLLLEQEQLLAQRQFGQPAPLLLFVDRRAAGIGAVSISSSGGT